MLKKIAKWKDGDSGYFTDRTQFRLARVRAPESYQFGSTKATKTAAGMTARTNGFVDVQIVGQSFGRQVVEMWNRDGSINNRMLKKGYWNKGR